MNTGDFPRAMAEVARHRTVAGVRDAIAQALAACGAEHVQVWLGGDGEGSFVEQEGHGSILRLPLLAGDEDVGALVVRVTEPLAGFQKAHLRTFADLSASLIANARAFEQAVDAQRAAQAALASALGQRNKHQ